MSEYPALPISLYVRDRLIVVVGHGPGADEREERLRSAGASVTRVAPQDYEPALLRSAFAVVANDDDAALNRRVAQDARRAGALAYAHDHPALSDFAMPALIRRGPLTIAIATDGTAPSLARRLRQLLEEKITAAGARLDTLLAELAAARTQLPRDRRRLASLANRFHFTGEVRVDEDSTE